MDSGQQRIATLRELLRRADVESEGVAQDDYRRKPRPDVDAHPDDHRQASSAGEDWSGTLDLVLRAGEKLVAGEERVRTLEAELRGLTESTSQAIQQLRAQVSDLQDQLDNAAAGRGHAEDWLRRLSDAVRERFNFEAVQDSETRAAQVSQQRVPRAFGAQCLPAGAPRI